MKQVLSFRFFLLAVSTVVVGGCGQADSPSAPGQSPMDAGAGGMTVTTGAPVVSTGASGAGGASSSGGTATGGGFGPSDAADDRAMQPQVDASDGAAGAGGGAPDAGGAAGAGGGGALDAGGDGPKGCHAAFCESFEDIANGAPPNPAIWTRTSTDLVVDSTRAALGGKKSLHIPAMVSGAKYIRENKTVATLGTAFYGRVFFWIDKQPIEKPATLYHWTLLEADEGDSINAGRVLRLGGHIEASGTNWLRFNFETHGNPGETGLSDPNLVVSTQRWYCAEFYYSMPDNEARFWLDGVEDPTLHWKGPMGAYTFPPAIAWMTFGWAEYQVAVTPWEVWIDEIALDKNQVGCD